jgi:hypothetical protein
MTRAFSAFRTSVGVLCCLAAINIVLFGFVVVLDAFFGIAPQFSVPLVTAVLIAAGVLVAAVLQAKRLPSAAEAQREVSGVHAQQTRPNVRRSRQPSATFRSAMIIRRRQASIASNQTERGTSYATSSTVS